MRREHFNRRHIFAINSRVDNYHITPPTCREIRKSGGGVRRLWKYTLMDTAYLYELERQLARAYLGLWPIATHGYIKGRGTQSAHTYVSEKIHELSVDSVVLLDIKDAFGSTNMYTVLDELHDQQVASAELEYRVNMMLNDEGSVYLKQGNPTSPILFNIALRGVDNSMLSANDMYLYCRYSDNILLATNSRVHDINELVSSTSNLLASYGYTVRMVDCFDKPSHFNWLGREIDLA